MQQQDFPDFFIIGTAKAGTSSLFTYLSRHPQVGMSRIKEPQYYSDDSMFAKGAGWYTSLFRQGDGTVMRGEASTTYSRHPHTPDVPCRIYRDVPNARFIYLMRHPVARSYSHYCHHMREGVTMTFEQALEKSSIYTDCSLYIEQIDYYLRFFSREQMLFLFYDEFGKDPGGVLRKIQDFLGLKYHNLLAEGTVFYNKTGADYYIRRLTTQKLRRIGVVNTLAGRVPQRIKDYLFSSLKKAPYIRNLERNFRYPPMTMKTRESLLEYFDSYNKRLEKFLEVDLHAWYHYEVSKQPIPGKGA